MQNCVNHVDLVSTVKSASFAADLLLERWLIFAVPADWAVMEIAVLNVEIVLPRSKHIFVRVVQQNTKTNASNAEDTFK